MKRADAVEVLKQILNTSSSAHCKSITLLLHPKNGLSKGYQITLECKEDEILQSHVEKIAKDNGLAIKKEGELLIVYRP
jgi:hypothetical protein